MKIFLAGNMPLREREEKEMLKKGFIKYRLFSYFFLSAADMKNCINLYLK